MSYRIRIMKNEQIQQRRDTGISKAMLPTEREVLLARLLLRVCDALGKHDRDTVFVALYDECKALAEGTVRDGRS